MINIDELIKLSMKAQDKSASTLYREIKAAILNFKTAKNAKPYDEAAEIQLLNKIKNQHLESLEIAKSVHRDDLVIQEENYISKLNLLIPAAPSEEEIDYYTAELVPSLDGEVKMGDLIKMIKSKFPTAEGKIVAKIAKRYV